MLIQETPLPGAYIIDVEKKSDERGFFARAFCRKELDAVGIQSDVAQINICYNGTRGTLRGMHFQIPPASETKLIRCTRGAIYDVIVDLRPDSPTYLEHFGVELTADNFCALYVPQMFAHGYQTLTPEAEIVYVVSEFYTPGCERGLRHDDPKLMIEWPLPVSLISEKDKSWDLL
jgi:dTDP-4-dehydrorhamnose 3,5-epimerase